MPNRASGPFEVALKPLPSDASREGVSFSRLSLDKQFHGELEATSKGEMLSAGTSLKGRMDIVIESGRHSYVLDYELD